MNAILMPAQRKQLWRTCILVAAVLALAGIGLGYGDAVRAAFDPPALPKPYDPMQSW